MIEAYYRYLMNPESGDTSILSACDITNELEHRYDERISKVILYINSLKTIDKSIIDDLSAYIFLSQSRMSHYLNKKQV